MNIDMNRLKVIIILNVVITVDLILKTLFFKMITNDLFFTTCIILVSYSIKGLLIMYFNEYDNI